MALAVLATAYGGPDVLALEQVDTGTPGPGQVLVEVQAAGVNPIDYKVYSGAGSSDPAKLPIRLGYEAAGQVKAVGEGAEGPVGPLHPGDEVIAYPVQGAYATELVARASSVLPKPAAISAEQASGLMLTGVTAFHAVSAAEIRAADTVVIHGAAGGVGLMVVQLAADLGARVIGTASESGHAYLRQLGAEPVVYGEGLVDRIRPLLPTGSMPPSTRWAPTRRSTPLLPSSLTAKGSLASPPSGAAQRSASSSSGKAPAPTRGPRYGPPLASSCCDLSTRTS